MPYSLIVQYPYQSVQIALCQNGKILNLATLHKFDAIAQTIPTMIQLLDSYRLNLGDLSFFGVNIGPGPYNTLRALLTMINGIHRVSHIPLVAMNALDLLEQEISQENSLIILNAFENHVFYSIKTRSKKLQAAGSIPDLVQIIKEEKDFFIIQGNGAIKYQEELKTLGNISWPEEIMHFNKIETLATATLQKFKKDQYNDQYLKPIYFEELSTTIHKL